MAIIESKSYPPLERLVANANENAEFLRRWACDSRVECIVSFLHVQHCSRCAELVLSDVAMGRLKAYPSAAFCLACTSAILTGKVPEPVDYVRTELQKFMKKQDLLRATGDLDDSNVVIAHPSHVPPEMIRELEAQVASHRKIAVQRSEELQRARDELRIAEKEVARKHAQLNDLSDKCGALRTENSEILRENAILRRKLEAMGRKLEGKKR